MRARRILWGLFVLAMTLVPLMLPHARSETLWRADLEPGTVIVNASEAAVQAGDIPVYVALVLILVGSDAGRRRSLRSLAATIIRKLNGYWWALLIGWAALSIIWSAEPVLSAYYSLHLLLTFVLAMLTAYMVREGFGGWMLVSLLIGGCLQSVIALAQVINDDPLGLRLLGELQTYPNLAFREETPGIRGYGLTVHPNNLAGYLMTAIIGGLLLFPRADSRRVFVKRVAVAGGMVVCGVGLLATGSRTMLLLTVMTLALVSAVGLRVSWRGLLAQKWQVAALTLVAVLGGLGVAILAPQLVDSTLQRLEELTVNPAGLFNRFVFAFRDTIPILETHPILGVGNGALILSIGRAWPGSRVLLLPAHNVYVFVWAELGIIGLFLLLMGLLGALARLHRRSSPGVVVMSALLLAICAAMVFDFYFWGDVRSRALLFWVIGMGWGYSIIRDNT